MSQTKVYVGNLPYRTDDAELEQLFGAYGEVTEVRIVMDRESGRSKGFGFITFAEAEGANNALKADGTELQGRKLRVNLANDDARRTGGANGRGPRPSFRQGGSNHDRGQY